MNKAVVLAAGKGSRLYPVTHHVAKPLLPIANRITVSYAFDRLQEIGLTDVCLVVGEQNEAQMKEALGDGTQFGVKLSYVVQSTPQGLAHALGFAKDFVNNDPFVLYLGDAIYTTGFQAFAAEFEARPCANLSIVKEVNDATRFGVAVFGPDHRVTQLVEKSPNPPSNFAMAGLYFFGPEIWSVLPTLQPSERGEYEVTDAIQLLVNQGNEVRAGVYDGHWFDTGTLPSFLEVSKFLTSGQKLIDASAKVNGSIGPWVVMGENAVIECEWIEDSVVLPGAVVKGSGKIHGCLLGGRCEVDGKIQNEIVWGADRS